MEKNPLLLAEGIAQGASDALEQKGICYCAGYIIGPILATKGITKGIEKLRVAYSARQASKALKAKEAAMQGADDLANPAVNSMDDVGRVAEGGSASKVGDFTNLYGSTVDDILDRIPDEATLRELHPVAGGSTEGFEFKWTQDGQTYRVRVHNADPGAPSGSNAANGWIVRV